MVYEDDFEYESIQDPETIRGLLESLIEGIQKGTIILSSNGDEIVLRPAPLMKFSIKASRKGTAGKLSLKISWKDDKDVDPGTNGGLQITS